MAGNLNGNSLEKSLTWQPPTKNIFSRFLLETQTCVVLFLLFYDLFNSPISRPSGTGIVWKSCLLHESFISLERSMRCTMITLQDQTYLSVMIGLEEPSYDDCWRVCRGHCHFVG